MGIPWYINCKMFHSYTDSLICIINRFFCLKIQVHSFNLKDSFLSIQLLRNPIGAQNSIDYNQPYKSAKINLRRNVQTFSAVIDKQAELKSDNVIDNYKTVANNSNP